MAYVNTTHTPAFTGGFSFAKLRGAFARGLIRMQVARMQSVLSQMPTEQLREIGISRGEIADYAEMLIIGTSKN